MSERAGSAKSADAYRTISEVAEELKLPQHVLRFWETRFPQVRPLKRAGGRRFYRPDDVALLRAVKALLYGQGYTIKGVQRLLQEHGPRGVASSLAVPAATRPPPGDMDPRDEDAGVTDRDADLPGGPSPAAPAAPVSRVTAAPFVAQAAAAPASRDRLLALVDALGRELAECGRILAAVRPTAPRG